MKKQFNLYLSVLIHFRTKGTCSDIALLSKRASHDQLNRFLKADWCGQTLLHKSMSFLENVKGGYLMIDSTVIDHPHSKGLDGSSYVYCSTLRRVVRGYEVLMVAWTDGLIRVPIAVELYRKGGESKIQMTLDILSYVRNNLKMKPSFVLMDSWFAARVVLERIDNYGWGFITRFKKNRNFNGVRLQDYRDTPYWKETGTITGGLKVTVVRHRKGYFATNRHSLLRQEIVDTYPIRQNIEEIFRCMKQECSLNACQLDDFYAQERHLYLSIFAFSIIEREREEKNITFYNFRNKLISRRTSLRNVINDYFPVSA